MKSFLGSATHIALALFIAVLSAPAYATGEIETLITQADRDRLAKFDEFRDAAIIEARREGSAADIAELDGVIDVDLRPWSDFDMTGNWQCRTLKLGGLSGLVVYSWFRCRVTDDGSGWRLQKLTGSQRTNGRFFTENDTTLTYLGVGSVNDDAPAKYGAGPDSDQVGRAFRTGKTSWRIEFPAPRYESKFDILELRR